MNPLDFLLGKTKPSTRGSVPGFPPAPRGRFPSSWGVPKVPVSAVPNGGAGTLLFNPITAAYSIPGYSEQKTRNAAGVIEGTRGPLNELQYIGGELLRGRMPYSNPYNGIKPEYGGPNAAYYGPAYASAQALGLGGSTPSLRNYGPGYKEKELAAGAAAERFRPGAGFPGQQGAADRAYQQELSRTAQLAAKDPELQRYEQRREAAKTQEEMNAVRDIGMEIWAKKYGGEKGLASRVKPGQVGYDVIQKTLYPQGSPLQPLPEDSLAMLNAIAPANAQGIRENVTPTLGQMPVFGDASEAMYQAVTNGGTLVTPMLSPQSKTTQQEIAQLLADTYKSSFLGDDEFAKRLRAMDPYMQ